MLVATLDGRFHDPDSPLLFADDLAAVRGDGVFESLLIRDGRPCLLQAHLQRLARSAELMGLPPPDIAAWQRTAMAVAQRWAVTSRADGVLRLVYSRGRESGHTPTGYLVASAVPERVADVRRHGLAALTLDRGLSGTASAAPWLLAGAKTLSYAVNMAALRYAAERGAGDVIFLSTDGLVLEGPRSTVVIATEDAMLTPPPSLPILHGTTQQALFAIASAKGQRCEYRPLRRADLLVARGVWLVSSITLGARVHTLDGEPLPDTDMAAEFSQLVDAAIVGDR